RCTGCPMRHVPPPRPQGFPPCESSGVLATVFSRRLDPPPRRSLLLQVFTLAAVGAPSRPFRSWPWSRVRRSRPRYRPSACYRRRARLSSPEVAYLLEVPGLQLPPSCDDFRCEARSLLAVRFDRRPTSDSISLQRPYQTFAIS